MVAKKVVKKEPKLLRRVTLLHRICILGLILNEVDELDLREVIRSMGRDKAKKGPSSNTSVTGRGVDIHGVASNFEIRNLNFESCFSFEMKKLEDKKKAREEKQRTLEEKQRSRDTKFLTKPFNYLTENEFNMVLRARVDIMKKYYKQCFNLIVVL